MQSRHTGRAAGWSEPARYDHQLLAAGARPSPCSRALQMRDAGVHAGRQSARLPALCDEVGAGRAAARFDLLVMNRSDRSAGRTDPLRQLSAVRRDHALRPVDVEQCPAIVRKSDGLDRMSLPAPPISGRCNSSTAMSAARRTPSRASGAESRLGQILLYRIAIGRCRSRPESRLPPRHPSDYLALLHLRRSGSICTPGDARDIGRLGRILRQACDSPDDHRTIATG